MRLLRVFIQKESIKWGDNIKVCSYKDLTINANQGLNGKRKLRNR
jgi:hypothetical protein